MADSLRNVMRKLKTAVKKGVVAPMAWLKETGMYLREVLPQTTEKQKTRERAAILRNCLREEMGWGLTRVKKGMKRRE